MLKAARENYRSEVVVGKALCNNYESSCRMHLKGGKRGREGAQIESRAAPTSVVLMPSRVESSWEEEGKQKKSIEGKVGYR